MELAVRFKGLVDADGGEPKLAFLQAPASLPNPSKGVGDKGQGWQAGQSLDDIIAHILAGELTHVQPNGINLAGFGDLSQAGKWPWKFRAKAAGFSPANTQ